MLAKFVIINAYYLWKCICTSPNIPNRDLGKILLDLSNIISFKSCHFLFFYDLESIFHVQSPVMILLHLDFYYVVMEPQKYILNSTLQISFKLNAFGKPVALIWNGWLMQPPRHKSLTWILELMWPVHIKLTFSFNFYPCGQIGEKKKEGNENLLFYKLLCQLKQVKTVCGRCIQQRK